MCFYFLLISYLINYIYLLSFDAIPLGFLSSAGIAKFLETTWWPLDLSERIIYLVIMSHLGSSCEVNSDILAWFYGLRVEGWLVYLLLFIVSCRNFCWRSTALVVYKLSLGLYCTGESSVVLLLLSCRLILTVLRFFIDLNLNITVQVRSFKRCKIGLIKS